MEPTACGKQEPAPTRTLHCLVWDSENSLQWLQNKRGKAVPKKRLKLIIMRNPIEQNAFINQNGKWNPPPPPCGVAFFPSNLDTTSCSPKGHSKTSLY